MIMKNVFVITNPENGWDCVCRVFTTNEAVINFCGKGYNFTYIYGRESLEQYSHETPFIIHEKQLIE